MREKIAKPKKFRQNTEVKNHFHPRSLARAVVHNMMAHDDLACVNKVIPGTTQSAFSKNWRNIAERISAER